MSMKIMWEPIELDNGPKTIIFVEFFPKSICTCIKGPPSVALTALYWTKTCLTGGLK